MSLRIRITLTTLLSTLLVVIGLQLASSYALNMAEQRFESATVAGKALLWKEVVRSEIDTMQNGISSVSRDRSVRDALQRGDGKALEANALTTFRRLSASGVLDTMQIVDSRLTTLFSTPEGRVGGANGSALVARAIAEGMVVRGIERIEGGKPMSMLAFPLTMRGKTIGAALFAKGFDTILGNYKANDDSDLFVVSDSGQLEYSTNPELFRSLDVDASWLVGQAFKTLQVEEQTLAIASNPILDSRGEISAYLLVVGDHSASYQSQRQTSTVTYIAILVILLLVGFGMAWYIRRSFKPLERVVDMVSQIAEGDLQIDMASNYGASSNDEIGKVMSSMAKMVTSLRELIGKIHAMGEQLGISVNQLRTIASDTQSGVQQQLSETEQVATAMNEMAATVQEVANHASGAAEAASQADRDADSGQQVVKHSFKSINVLAQDVRQAAEAMHRLEGESREIGSVLDVIRGIAEQTNLLALNAAIEAARAGEQGRGFAVVADEVRTLASRTQKSTEDIQAMIERLQTGAKEATRTMEASLERVNDNVERVSATETALQTIADAVRTINDMNLQIASAAEEQTSVAEEINRNVVNISHIAEGSAEGADNTSQACDEISSMVQGLRGLIARFKV